MSDVIMLDICYFWMA